MEDYGHEHQVFLLDDIITRQRENRNRLKMIGAAIVGYEFNKDYNGCSGFYEYPDREQNIRKKGRFFQITGSKDITAAEMRRFFRKLSSITDEGILSPTLVGYWKEKQTWVIGYEDYDKLFTYWLSNMFRERNHPKMKKDNSILLPFWRNLIKGLLDTVNYIHTCGLIHNDLKNLDSYCCVADKVKMRMTLSCAQYDSNDPNAETLKAQDFMDLGEFLKNNVLNFQKTSIDRDCFLSAFKQFQKLNGGQMHEALRSHPFLEDEREQLEGINDMCTEIATFRVDRDLFRNALNETFPELVGDWSTLIPKNPLFASVFGYKPLKSRDGTPLAADYKHYNSSNVMDFLFFFRHIINHYGKRLEQETVDKIQECVRDFYPGCFSYSYEIFVKVKKGIYAQRIGEQMHEAWRSHPFLKDEREQLEGINDMCTEIATFRVDRDLFRNALNETYPELVGDWSTLIPNNPLFASVFGYKPLKSRDGKPLVADYKHYNSSEVMDFLIFFRHLINHYGKRLEEETVDKIQECVRDFYPGGFSYSYEVFVKVKKGIYAKRKNVNDLHP